jgi:hypothetical protein
MGRHHSFERIISDFGRYVVTTEFRIPIIKFKSIALQLHQVARFWISTVYLDRKCGYILNSVELVGKLQIRPPYHYHSQAFYPQRIHGRKRENK